MRWAECWGGTRVRLFTVCYTHICAVYIVLGTAKINYLKTRNISGHLIWCFWWVGAIVLILVPAKFCHKNDE